MTAPADRRAYDIDEELRAIVGIASRKRLPPAQRIAALEGHVSVLIDRVHHLTFEVKRLRQRVDRIEGRPDSGGVERA